MADVEMTDAPSKAKASKADTADSGKKRFEVKKVSTCNSLKTCLTDDDFQVERCCTLGLGHCRRQLCHLP
jgi:hypothetical protein